jgi:hypothetical protein
MSGRRSKQSEKKGKTRDGLEEMYIHIQDSSKPLHFRNDGLT